MFFLGWFVLIDIGIVCAAAVVIIVVDNLRSLAITHSRRTKEEKKKNSRIHFADFLVPKRNFRIARIFLPVLDRNTRPPGPPPISP